MNVIVSLLNAALGALIVLSDRVAALTQENAELRRMIETPAVEPPAVDLTALDAAANDLQIWLEQNGFPVVSSDDGQEPLPGVETPPAVSESQGSAGSDGQTPSEGSFPRS